MKADDDRNSSAGKPWWLGRPSPRETIRTMLACCAFALSIGTVAAVASPLAVRSLLPLSEVEGRSLYLSTLLDDPGRVLLTPRRSKASVRRSDSDPSGGRYWIHEYADPARPDLPPRVLLSSRRRGARLLLPAGAFDLERALSRPADLQKPGRLGVRTRLVQLYRDLLYTGVFLEIRFPERPRGRDGNSERFDLVAVRGNRVRTVDFVLLPNARFYRADIALGRSPLGDFQVSTLPQGRELVFALPEDPEQAARSLSVPVSLFDELALAWPGDLPTILDDRWQLEALPEFALEPPTPEARQRAADLIALYLAARLTGPDERARLAREVAGLVEE